jgi:enamine deaminase RidA (YjgF/YER057c/UK114 family)
VGQIVSVSGQGPLDPAANVPIAGTLCEQADRTLDNLKRFWSDIAKVTIYLSDLRHVLGLHSIYQSHIPARSPLVPLSGPGSEASTSNLT